MRKRMSMPSSRAEIYENGMVKLLLGHPIILYIMYALFQHLVVAVHQFAVVVA